MTERLALTALAKHLMNKIQFIINLVNTMKKILLTSLLICFCLTGCLSEYYDESTLITDDNGRVHRTKHYKLDTRGRDYFPQKITPPGGRQFIFDPKVSAWAAYDAQGNRVMTGSGSGGKDICDENGQSCRTVTGNFHIYNKRGIDCKSGEYPVETTGGAKMPYCMYFYRGFTIHAAYEVPAFSSSHGCVRVLPSAAKWLNEEFLRVGTQVIVLAYADENEVKKRS